MDTGLNSLAMDSMTDVEENGTSVGAYEAKTHLSDLLLRVHQGEEITITRYGAPIARLVPVRNTASPEVRRSAIDRWMQHSQRLSLGDVTIRELLDDGRP